MALDAIRTWAAEAKRSILNAPGGYNPPALEALVNVMPGNLFRTADIQSKDEHGRLLFKFEITGPREIDGKVIRFMLPVHATITRVLEIAGAKIKLMLGSGGNIEKSYLDLRIGKDRTNLHRILFGVSSEGRLWERHERENQYRYIVPSAYRQGSGVSRDSVIRSIKTLSATTPCSPDAIVLVLVDLFTISDEWHWDELIGRCDANGAARLSFRR